MIKYIVYAEDEDHPVIDGSAYKQIKKFKRGYDALDFTSDVRNLSKYGCMRLIKTTDDDGSFIWNPEWSAWERYDG